MIRSHASWNVTFMKDAKPMGHWPVMDFPGIDVSPPLHNTSAALVDECAIALVSFGGCPQPTRFGLSDLRPEAF